MKKFIELATVTVVILALASVFTHYEVNKEISDLLKTVALRIAPWVNTVIYS